MLADLYGSLTPQQWQTPSLCSGWRVHEVLAHATMPYRYSLPRVLMEVLRSGGNFNRMADRRARADAAALTPEALVEQLRANIEHPWAPPGGGALGTLSHEVIHGLDVSVPLGLDDHASTERVTAVWAGSRRMTECRSRDAPVTCCCSCAANRRVPEGRITGTGAARLRR